MLRIRRPAAIARRAGDRFARGVDRVDAYELAEQAATKAGRGDVARVAALRATALRGGPKPQSLGGL